MPILNWVGKSKVVNHHHEVPFRLLKKQYTFTAKHGVQKNSTNNRIIHGDNLEALKSLLPEFEGKVKCIYIDPPYNTGNENWVYNDNVNDPKIKKWLGQVVGKEGEDFSRHDKWLCMMYPRLKLLHRLLSDDGVMFVSIDDNEQANLKLVMEEIFGGSNFVANILWQKRTSPDARLKISDAHEHIICFAKNEGRLALHKIPQSIEQIKNFKNPDKDLRGVWASTDFSAQGFRPNQMYEIQTPSGRVVKPPAGNCWKNTEDVFKSLVADNRIWFGKNGDGVPRRKTFLSESEGVAPWSWWSNDEVGHSQEAKKEIKDILADAEIVFDTPKPIRLIERVLQISANKNAIVLDSFAGSGTTAHAVLKLNAQDGGNRRFICIEMMDYAETITAERVRRVIDGYGEETKAVDGIGGAFDFYVVGEPLFLEDKNLNEAVGTEAIREYVSYTESIPTKQRFSGDVGVSPYALGASETALWLFYYERDRITTLNIDFLENLNIKSLKKRPESFVIYADKCALDKDFLLKHGITFKRIPRDITQF
jgi:adenine-specific DNA-methyltransferase